MDENLKKEKVRRFLADKAMEQSVKEVLRETFLTQKNRNDVAMCAASFLAIDLLNTAWDNLDRYRKDIPEELKGKTQIGL